MKVLFDTNIILDLLLDREPFADVAERLLSRVETKELTGFLCATTITTIHYLAAKRLGNQNALREIRKLLEIFEIAPVDHSVLKSALDAGITDFEDAVLQESARQVGATTIVTRDRSGFNQTELTVYAPETLESFLNLPALLEPNF